MKFYLVEITIGDSKISGKAMYEYATKDEAIANFHAKMGVAMKSDLYTREQLLVIDENNSVWKSEVFERVAETPAEVTE